LRAILPVVSLLVVAFSLSFDLFPSAAGSRLCLHGGCRADQIYAGIDTSGTNQASLSTLLETDPANPLVWCAYAELLNSRGETGKAAEAFEHAVSLGPGMSPVLMRAANFDFTHGRRDHGIVMASRVLSQTGAFDQMLFSYLLKSGVPVPKLLGGVIPATPRVAQSWLEWLSGQGTDGDILSTWSWMRHCRLTSAKSAGDLAWTLWNRSSYQAAQNLWVEWLGPARGDYLRPQRLANHRFENAPDLSPFDWTLTPSASVELSRQDGLQIRFSGTDNVDFSQVRQFTTANSRRYRFSAEIQADGLTTDQRPFFHIFDPVHPNVLNVATEPLTYTVPRSWISVPFTVPAATKILEVQIERHPSLRFANRIAGTLHIYQVSLVPGD
jgi:hypothetical protein